MSSARRTDAPNHWKEVFGHAKVARRQLYDWNQKAGTGRSSRGFGYVPLAKPPLPGCLFPRSPPTQRDRKPERGPKGLPPVLSNTSNQQSRPARKTPTNQIRKTRTGVHERRYPNEPKEIARRWRGDAWSSIPAPLPASCRMILDKISDC